MLRDMVRGLCTDLAPFEKVREMEDHPDGVWTDCDACRRGGQEGCGHSKRNELDEEDCEAAEEEHVTARPPRDNEQPIFQQRLAQHHPVWCQRLRVPG